MKYYNVSDVMEITGLAQSASYELIKNLNKKLSKEYSGTVTLRAKIPKWYFDRKTMLEEGDKSGKHKQD